ncbi:hypothetical protein IMSAGC019_01271 [Lachnospiraceae bacterium]|nr:hypothetical protein IMSAGC019_01271 [Lachnospiraceae bacterium]
MVFQSTLPSREVTAILHKKIIEYVIMLYYLSIKLYKQIIIGKHIFSISEYIKQKKCANTVANSCVLHIRTCLDH